MHAFLNLPLRQKKVRSDRRRAGGVSSSRRNRFAGRRLETLERRELLAADLDVTASPAPLPSQALPGQLVDYTITVKNIGDAVAENSSVTIPMSPSADFFSAATDFATAVVHPGGGAVTVNLGNFETGATATIHVDVVPKSTFSGPLKLTATATTSSVEASMTNNTKDLVTEVGPAPTTAADLAVTTSAPPASVVPGQLLSYTITVTNKSASNPAQAVELRDVLDPSATFVSVAASQGTAVEANGAISAKLGDIAVNGTATVTINVLPTAGGALANAARAATGSGDTDTTNNGSSPPTPVAGLPAAPADLKIQQADVSGVAGKDLTYTLTITNLSAANGASAVQFVDALPAGATFVKGTWSGPGGTSGTVDNTHGVATATLGSLGPNQTATVTIDVIPTAAGKLVNTAAVGTSSGDSATGNNSVTTSATIGPANTVITFHGKPGDNTNKTFVQNLYVELLGRDADPAGLDFWMGQLSGSGAANAMTKKFLATDEYEQRVVQSLYQALLHRAADADGLQFFAGQLSHNVSQELVISELIGSQEYYTMNSGSADGFVKAVYQDLLGRTADPDGQAYWAQKVTAAAGPGTARSDTATQILASTESRRLLVDDASGKSPLPGHAWNQIFFDGKLSAQAQDKYFNELASKTPWEQVVQELLTSSQFFGV